MTVYVLVNDINDGYDWLFACEDEATAKKLMAAESASYADTVYSIFTTGGTNMLLDSKEAARALAIAEETITEVLTEQQVDELLEKMNSGVEDDETGEHFATFMDMHMDCMADVPGAWDLLRD